MRHGLARPNGQKTLALPGGREARVSVGEFEWLWPGEVAGGVEGHRTESAGRGLGVWATQPASLPLVR